MARKRGLSLVVLFGSVSAGAARPDSDIDIAVKFGDGDPGLPRILEVQEEISGIFRGQEVDLSVLNRADPENCASSIPPGWRPTWPIPKPPLFLVENGVRDERNQMKFTYYLLRISK